ncbi:MAG: hybrid sensor histidine kinase/response regulator [Verrucomicrobiales bacterium]|nr:hybrid sensor histidine kinase/response regulator [Verrucomicrobiales bacterium]MCP5560530.1 hybrid sensor histidine kinase/response regulator [Verrucomicrobiaceae bacterium]
MNSPSRQTILIVDDQEENIRVVGSVLSLMNYDIIAATSAAQAMKRLQARTPDIILLDVMMPEVDGLAACRQIKEDPRWAEIPIIFLSAADDKNVIVQALEAGGVDYVTKPFNRAELLTRVRTHLSLKQARDSLQRLAEDKDEILGILAHDLKNGIVGIQLSAGLLMERAGALPSRSASLAENICLTSDRLLDHLKIFLANQRAEHLQMHCAPVDLHGVVKRIITQASPAAQSKDITLDLVNHTDGVLVKADHEALSQAMENLVSNGVKFMPSGGTLQVIIERPMLGRVKCIVTDSGPGFSEEDRIKIFRRYQRLSAVPTGNEPSTGLGLSIVKRLLTQMNADITLSPGAGRLGGAEFVVSLEDAAGVAVDDTNHSS